MLPPSAHIGHVEFQVSKLERALGFYRDLLGLHVIDMSDNQAHLSATGKLPAIIVLTEVPNAIPKPRRSTGLYHVAILLPDRLSLGLLLDRLILNQYPLQGASDHAVSEALYLADPDGNGLEIYRDRPRSEWRYDNGSLYMTTEPFDLEGVLKLAHENRREWQLPADTVIGHVHLHVRDVQEAIAFYTEIVGFDLMVDWSHGGAAFLAAGGYHHHLGVNIWAGQGAPPPPDNAVGLKLYSIVLNDKTELQAMADHLKTIQISPLATTSHSITIHDPSANTIQFIAR